MIHLPYNRLSLVYAFINYFKMNGRLITVSEFSYLLAFVDNYWLKKYSEYFFVLADQSDGLEKVFKIIYSDILIKINMANNIKESTLDFTGVVFFDLDDEINNVFQSAIVALKERCEGYS